MSLPSMSSSQAQQLSGKRFKVGKSEFFFEAQVVSGGQAMAIPLRNSAGHRIAFFRTHSVTAKTPVNIERTSWLMGQQLHRLSDTFISVPQLWVDTRAQGRPLGIDFDFDGAILGLAIGQTWKSWKRQMSLGKTPYLHPQLRLKLAKGLIRRLASLEMIGPTGMTHGDLSDANIVIDRVKESLNLIDFECFVFDSPTLSEPKLRVRDGGSMGTIGYAPDWHLENRSLEGEPFGDRFARDMLLIEFLGFRSKAPCDESPLHWKEREEVLEEIKPLTDLLKLSYLQDTNVFEWWDEDRFTSVELAETLGLSIEDHTDKRLAAAPRRPCDIKPSSQTTEGNALPAEAEPASFNFPEFQWPSLDQLPSWEELPNAIVSFFMAEFDRLTISFGRNLFKLWNAFLISLPALALTVVWVLAFVYSLTSLSLPSNLIVCAGLIYVAYRCLLKLNVIVKSTEDSE